MAFRTIEPPIESLASSQVRLVPSPQATGLFAAHGHALISSTLGNTIEEADESALWLEILAESELAAKSPTDPLWKEADELVRILVRSRETARANRPAARRK